MASLQRQVQEASDAVEAAQDEAVYARMLASQWVKQFEGIAGWEVRATCRSMGDAPALPRVSSNRGYLAFFQEVVETLEAGVSHVKEDNASDAHELLGLALTLVFSNQCRLVLELDLQRVIESVLAESQRLLRDEVLPRVDALVERYVQVPVSSGKEGSDAEPVGAKGGIGNLSP